MPDVVRYMPAPTHEPTQPLVAIALTPTGRHPGAWREPDVTPATLLGARHWRSVIAAAEDARADFVTFDDGFSVHRLDTDETDITRTDVVAGQLDTQLLAARLAPITTGIGLLPTVVTTHTEPFHASKSIATLDYISRGRAGVVVTIDPRQEHAALFGRRALDSVSHADLLAEAADYAEVLRRLWDSWEDDAEIRHTATGRFIDRNKLHYIDFEGSQFSVRGPSITPRPPQGQPIIAADLDNRSTSFVGTTADIGFAVGSDDTAIADTITAARTAEARAERAGSPLAILVDLLVVVDDTAAQARARRARFDESAGSVYTGGIPVVAGTASDVADRIAELLDLGADGVRLHPAAIPHDLQRIAADLAPELRRRHRLRESYIDGESLRSRLGLGRPESRYAISELVEAAR
uniref:LLM class flavin-dependent oxidoreductase n=1 Tax=Gordonia sp. B7-2 TaxID=3420932 RepID=UPI003D8D36BD